LCQNLFELSDDLGRSTPSTHLDGILDLLAELVPDVFVLRQLDPGVLVSLEPGLDADHM